MRPVNAHVVMVDNELYFVLDKEYKIICADVLISTTTAPFENPEIRMWLGGPEKKGKILKFRQIKYGQNNNEFRTTYGPKELQKNMEYVVHIDMPYGKFAAELFIITDDNKITTPRTSFIEKIKNQTVTIERNGRKIVVPYSINIKDGSAVITSKPILEK
jgi:hypothetical protein